MVPGDYAGMSTPGAIRNEVPTTSSPGASKVVRVGNVLQVVPTTTIDWSNNSQPPIDRKNATRYPVIVPPSPINTSTSVPIPVPLPVPGPVAVNPQSLITTVSTGSISLTLPNALSLPVPLPIPANVTTPPKSKPVAPQGNFSFFPLFHFLFF